MSELREAIEAIKSGDKVRGRTLLMHLVKSQPHNEVAWMWLSTTVNNRAQKKQCLQQVLQINPHNSVAQQALTRLESDEMSEEMPNLTDIISESLAVPMKPTTDDINPNYIPREVLNNLKNERSFTLSEPSEQISKKSRLPAGSDPKAYYASLPFLIKFLMITGFALLTHFTYTFLVAMTLPNRTISGGDFLILGGGIVCLTVTFSYLIIRDNQRK